MRLDFRRPRATYGVFGLLVLAIAVIKTKADAAAGPDGDLHRDLEGLERV